MYNYKYDCDIIHETIIRDIIDIINDVKDSDEIQLLLNRKKSIKSIAKATANLVLVFPVIISNTINIETASIITKAIERKAVSMLQILFSAISISDSKDAFDFISKVHTNLKFDNKISIDDFIDTMDDYVKANESVEIVDPVTYNTVKGIIKEDMKRINNILNMEINETAIGNYKTINSPYSGIRVIKEDKLDDLKDDIDDEFNKEADILASKIAKSIGSSVNKSINNSLKYSKGKNNNAKELKDTSDFFRNQLLSSDVNKANELIPTNMIINFVSTSDDRDPIDAQAVIGVKAKMYPVDSADLLNRIKLKNQDRNGLLKLVKATTREISFCRDFLFAIDRAKLDALSQTKKGFSSEIWKILERRALKSKLRRRLGRVNDASAITTIVISQEEVDYLKKLDNIDVSKPQTIRPIMEAYNLIGFCIADEVLEVAKFIWDTGDDIYEHLSFNSLEKESSSNDYKKIVNLMSKVAR